MIPREHRFYDLFRQQGALVRQTLSELSQSLSEQTSRHAALRELEHRCDDITHELYGLTNRTFTTPIEQGDILLLAHALDEVVDLAEEAADKIDLYEVGRITEPAQRLGACIASAGIELAKALEMLEEPIGVEPVLLEIHRLENEGDVITRDALQELFNSNLESPTDLIKWKDVYSLLESTLDECETVAEIIEKIAIKNP